MTRDEGIEYLKNLPADEPVFVLRAKDRFAPTTVAVWTAMCASVTNGDSKPKIEAAHRKGHNALDLADRMRSYQHIHGCKTPD